MEFAKKHNLKEVNNEQWCNVWDSSNSVFYRNGNIGVVFGYDGRECRVGFVITRLQVKDGVFVLPDVDSEMYFYFPKLLRFTSNSNSLKGIDIGDYRDKEIDEVIQRHIGIIEEIYEKVVEYLNSNSTDDTLN